MGVEARAVLAYGVYFESQYQVSDFLSKYDVDEVDDLDNDVELTCLNMLDGEHFILGYRVDLYTPMSYYEDLWKKDFPDSGLEPEPHLEVQWR